MKSIDAPRAARVCVCLLYVLSTVCERRSVDANATLVGGWLFRRPVIYRLSCAQNSLSLLLSPFPSLSLVLLPSLSLLHSRLCSRERANSTYFRALEADAAGSPLRSRLFFSLSFFLPFCTSLCWEQALGGAGATSLLY